MSVGRGQSCDRLYFFDRGTFSVVSTTARVKVEDGWWEGRADKGGGNRDGGREGRDDLRDMKREQKIDWDLRERKLKERSRGAESGLNLIKAVGQDQQRQTGIRALENVTVHLFPSVNEASSL